MTVGPTFTHEPDDDDAMPVPLGAMPASVAHEARPLPPAQRIAPSAADMTSERVLRAQSEPPPSGWRRLLFRMTGGVMNAGPSAADRERRDLVGRVKDRKSVV